MVAIIKFSFSSLPSFFMHAGMYELSAFVVVTYLQTSFIIDGVEPNLCIKGNVAVYKD